MEHALKYGGQLGVALRRNGKHQNWAQVSSSQWYWHMMAVGIDSFTACPRRQNCWYATWPSFLSPKVPVGCWIYDLFLITKLENAESYPLLILDCDWQWTWWDMVGLPWIADCWSGWWFGTSILFSHILGMSSSQLTFIFFRGVAQPPTSDDCQSVQWSFLVIDAYSCWVFHWHGPHRAHDGHMDRGTREYTKDTSWGKTCSWSLLDSMLLKIWAMMVEGQWVLIQIYPYIYP